MNDAKNWYAADACLRETTRHGFGFPQTREEFVKAITVHLEKVEVIERRGARRCTAQLRYEYTDTPAEYWVLEFARTGSKWEPMSGYKCAGGKRTSDLFQDEYLGFIKIMGSMKPYFEKALAAYSEGKDFRVIFPQK